MTDSDTQKQLEELRSQVAALKEARRARPEEPEPEAPEAPTGIAASDAHDISTQIKELVGLMEGELRDNPVVTGVAIFVAGLLVGRLLR